VTSVEAFSGPGTGSLCGKTWLRWAPGCREQLATTRQPRPAADGAYWGGAIRGRLSRAPTLGQRDEFLPVNTVARPLADLLRTDLVILPGGHFTPLACPAGVGTALREFFARLSPEL
jgi:pimeloyl-ACP methyl ester carboxylesterase